MSRDARQNSRDKTMTAEKTYVRLVEHNDHEGETWNFFVENTENNVTQLLKLRTQVVEFAEADDDEMPDLDEVFLLNMEPLAASVVDALCREGNSGYMPQFNKFDGELTCPDFQDQDQLLSALNKGGIRTMIAK